MHLKTNPPTLFSNMSMEFTIDDGVVVCRYKLNYAPKKSFFGFEMSIA